MFKDKKVLKEKVFPFSLYSVKKQIEGLYDWFTNVFFTPTFILLFLKREDSLLMRLKTN